LSEKKYTGKALKQPAQMRVHKIDSISRYLHYTLESFTQIDINNALNFCWQCGVSTKVKPSAENLVDMDEKSILGLIWAVSLVVISFGFGEIFCKVKIFCLII
jgi:hypothetical protein